MNKLVMFLAGQKITVTAAEGIDSCQPWSDGKQCFQFKIKVKSNKKSASFDFYGSQNDYWSGQYILDKAGLKSAFECILSDADIKGSCCDLDDFINVFGYEIESTKDFRQAESIYKACLKSAKKLDRVFEGQLNEVQNAFMDYLNDN